jgi:hypothetical protein
VAKAKTEEGELELHPKRIANPNAKCPNHPDKDLRKLVKAAWKQGWWCERRRKYVYCYAVDEARTIVKAPMTPSDWRTYRNVTRNFEAAGLSL